MLNPQFRKNLELARNLSRPPMLRPELVLLGQPQVSLDPAAPRDIFIPRDPSLDLPPEPRTQL